MSHIVPYASARPEVRQSLSLLMNGRTMNLSYPNKSGQELMHWLKEALFSLDGSGLERIEWVKTEIHCFWVAGFMTVCLLAMRSVVFWLLDGHARRSVVDPKEEKMSELPPDEQVSLQKSKEMLVKKYKKYVWHGIAYIIMFAWGCRILYLAPWSAFNQLTFDYMSIGWPHHDDLTKYPTLMEEFQIFTMLQLSWYLAGGVENLIHDRSRGDFFMMLLHHVLTVVLIYGAFVSDAHRCAVHITVTLDIGDISMYYCKAFHLRTTTFDGKAKPGYSFPQLIHLAMLTGIWIVTRLYFYGLEILTMWMHNPFENAPFVGSYLKIFLTFLWVLQLFWGIALSKMVIDQARNGEFRDNLSGDIDNKKLEKDASKMKASDSTEDVSSGVGDDVTTPDDSSDDAAPAEEQVSMRRRL